MWGNEATKVQNSPSKEREVTLSGLEQKGKDKKKQTNKKQLENASAPRKASMLYTKNKSIRKSFKSPPPQCSRVTAVYTSHHLPSELSSCSFNVSVKRKEGGQSYLSALALSPPLTLSQCLQENTQHKLMRSNTGKTTHFKAHI